MQYYHYPRCSKSRQGLKLLEEHGLEPEIVKYMKEPPSPEQLTQLLDMLGMEPRELMRTREAAYEDNDLGDESLSREALIEAMSEHPRLIQRPIFVRDGKAVLGRPPEKVLELVGEAR